MRGPGAGPLSSLCHKRKLERRCAFAVLRSTHLQWKFAPPRGESLRAIEERFPIQSFERFPRLEADAAPDAPRPTADREAADVAAWRERSLKPAYAVIGFDALPVRLRDGAGARDGALSFCIGIDRWGEKDVLGLWPRRTGAANAWSRPLAELRERGVRQVQAIVSPGDAELTSALAAHFPRASRHPSLPPLLHRTSILVEPRRRRAVGAAVTDILGAPNSVEAQSRLERFARSRLGESHPDVVALWRRTLPELANHFALPAPARRFLAHFDAYSSLKAKLARRAVRLGLCFDGEAEALAATVRELATIAPGWHAASRLWLPFVRHLSADSRQRDGFPAAIVG